MNNYTENDLVRIEVNCAEHKEFLLYSEWTAAVMLNFPCSPLSVGMFIADVGNPWDHFCQVPVNDDCVKISDRSDFVYWLWVHYTIT